MMGPDYTHWHGTYEIAKHFYVKLIPALEKLVAENIVSKDTKRVEAAKALDATIQEVLNSPDHQWYLGKENEATKAARKKRQTEFKKRYDNK
jgi:hypothetical protein